MDLPFHVSSEFIELCQNWHSGQWSSMYSVASTGTIHSAEILRGLASELRDCRKAAPEDDILLMFLDIIEHMEETLPEDD